MVYLHKQYQHTIVKSAGRPKNVGKTLSDEQEKRIIRQLIHKSPRQLQFKFALWTREAVKHLIKHELDKENADIWWGDEIACVSIPSNLKGYAQKGSKIKPILTHPAQKFNPDEYLNQDKKNANKNNLPFTKAQLKKNTVNYMNEIVKNKQKVANFFKHPSIAYAA